MRIIFKVVLEYLRVLHPAGHKRPGQYYEITETFVYYFLRWQSALFSYSAILKNQDQQSVTRT